MRGEVAFALTALLMVAGAPATGPTLAGKGQAAKPANPNRQICQREEQTGSRLGGRRVCKTAAEWAAQRADMRLQIEREQAARRCATMTGC